MDAQELYALYAEAQAAVNDGCVIEPWSDLNETSRAIWDYMAGRIG